MKRFILKGIIFISFIASVTVSCTQGSCFEETESYLKATFYTKINEVPKAIPPDTLSLAGLGQDSIIYNNSTGVKIALIPLNSSAESSTFIITINKVADTITFLYSSYPHLISKECGYTYYHSLDTVLHSDHIIKEIFKSNPTITNLNVENIRIFY
jgi:hypothetical protein